MVDDVEIDSVIKQTAVQLIANVKDVTSAKEAQHVIESLGSAGASAKKHLLPRLASTEAAHNPHLLSSSTGNGLLGELTGKVLKLQSDLGSDSPSARQLGSSLLHLVAELYLGEDAQDEVLAKYAGQLGVHFLDLYQQDRLSEEQVEVIQRLQEPLLRKKEIAQEKA